MTSPRHYRITVVMAARNAADTIAQAIDSVAAQDFGDYRLIVVNDRSTDDTADKIREASHRYPLLINDTCTSEPGGYASALADVFRWAYSDYLICCDADDIMLPGALTALEAEASRTDADIVIGPMVRCCNGKRHTLHPRSRIRSLADMPLDTVHFSLCNKLLRTEILLRYAVPFRGIDRWADLGVVSRMVAAGAKVTTIKRPVYRYNIRPGSLSLSSKEAIIADRLAMTDRLIGWFDEQGLTADNASFIRLLKFCAKVKYARQPGRDLTLWRDTYPEINPYILTLRHVPLHYRLLFHLAAILSR